MLRKFNKIAIKYSHMVFKIRINKWLKKNKLSKVKLLLQKSTSINIKIFSQIKYGLLYIFMQFLFRQNQYDRYAFVNVLGTWGSVAAFTEEMLAKTSPYI